MHQWHVISLLIHGFLPVNARLLIAFGTAFYAITFIIPPCPSEHMTFVQRLPNVVKTSMALGQRWVDVEPTSRVH